MLLIISELFISLSMLGVAVFFLLLENCEDCNNGGTETVPNKTSQIQLVKSAESEVVLRSFFKILG